MPVEAALGVVLLVGFVATGLIGLLRVRERMRDGVGQ